MEIPQTKQSHTSFQLKVAESFWPKHYEEENCYSAGFIVGCLSGQSRTGEGRQEKQPGRYGDGDNMLPLWGKEWRELHLLSPTAAHPARATFATASRDTEQGQDAPLAPSLAFFQPSADLRDARLAEEWETRAEGERSRSSKVLLVPPINLCLHFSNVLSLRDKVIW